MKKIGNIFSWVCLIGVIIFLMAFTEKKQELVNCQDFKVIVEASANNFVDEQLVNNLLKKEDIFPIGKLRAEMEIDKIERALTNHSMIEEAHAYSDIIGNIGVDLIQRTPIVRVHSLADSFYIDDNGERMNLSDSFTARVLVISGNINLMLDQELFLLARYIYNSVFWKAQIMQVFVESNGDILLIPRVGYQKIIFGKVRDIEEKFNKLKLFYKKGANEGWNKYSEINLKFKNQVVCTRKL